MRPSRLVASNALILGLGETEVVPIPEFTVATIDLAVDSQDRPYVVTYTSTGAKVHRRDSDGTWRTNATVTGPFPENLALRSVAIACHADTLHLFYVLEGNITEGGNTFFFTSLRHGAASTAGNFTTATFSNTLVAQNATAAGTPASIASGMSAGVSSTGLPLVAYGDGIDNLVKVSSRIAGGSWITEALPVPPPAPVNLQPREVGVATSAGGRVHVAWRWSSAGDVAYSTRQGTGSWDTSVITGVGGSSPSIAVDKAGSPHVVGVSPFGASLAPMAARPLDITDKDGDGFTYLEEIAFGMNPNVPSRGNAPIFQIQTTGGLAYPTLAYRRQAGGSPFNSNPHVTANFIYAVETSTDLINWSFAPADVVFRDYFSLSGQLPVAIWRTSRPLPGNEQQFLRVRVERK